MHNVYYIIYLSTVYHIDVQCMDEDGKGLTRKAIQADNVNLPADL